MPPSTAMLHPAVAQPVASPDEKIVTSTQPKTVGTSAVVLVIWHNAREA